MDLLQKRVLPQTVRQTCNDWSAFTGHDVVDEIDSGLRRRDLVERVGGGWGLMPEM